MSTPTPTTQPNPEFCMPWGKNLGRNLTLSQFQTLCDELRFTATNLDLEQITMDEASTILGILADNYYDKFMDEIEPGETGLVILIREHWHFITNYYEWGEPCKFGTPEPCAPTGYQGWEMDTGWDNTPDYLIPAPLVTIGMATWQASEMLNDLNWSTLEGHFTHRESGRRVDLDRYDIKVINHVYNLLCEQSTNWGSDDDSWAPTTPSLTPAQWDVITEIHPIDPQDLARYMIDSADEAESDAFTAYTRESWPEEEHVDRLNDFIAQLQTVVQMHELAAQTKEVTLG